jgi:type I restriction enzyme, S subunit
MHTQTFLDNFATIAEAPGGVQRLRDLVLDLAVCGRLVDQNPHDEHAVMLLRSIAEERLVAPSALTEPVAVDDALWNIPNSWCWARLKQFCDLTAGRTPPTKDSTFWAGSDGHPWVAIGDMPAGGKVCKTARSVSARARDEIFRGEPDPVGTILMSFKLTIGKMARLAVPAFHNEAIVKIATPFEPTREYLFRVLPLLTKSGNSKAAIMGSTLNRTSLTNLLIPLPPLAEQVRIVAKVDELMGLCDELEGRQDRKHRAVNLSRGAVLHALTSAETPADVHRTWERVSTNWPVLMDHPESIAVLRQVILQLAVQGKLARQDANDVPAQDLLAHIQEQQSVLKGQRALGGVRMPPLGPWLPAPPLPPSWVWTTLGSVLRHCRNGTSATPNDHAVGYPILRISAGTSDPNGVVDLDDHKFTAVHEVAAAPYVLESGDLLACRFNGNLRFVGRVAIVPDHQGTYLHPDKLIRIKAISVDHRFLAVALNSTVTRQQIEGAASTTAGNIGINGAQFQALHIPLPPLAEQRRIAEKVGLLFGLCSQLEERMPSRDRLADRTADALVRHLSRTA